MRSMKPRWPNTRFTVILFWTFISAPPGKYAADFKNWWPGGCWANTELFKDSSQQKLGQRQGRCRQVSRSPFPSNSGNRATLTAIRRASSLVSTLGCVPGVDVGERLDDIAARYRVGPSRSRKSAVVHHPSPPGAARHRQIARSYSAASGV